MRTAVESTCLRHRRYFAGHGPRLLRICGTPAPSGFTLIEFILVMALLAVVMAFAAPSLSRFFRHGHLEEEAVRFVALTEYARNEAVSQGMPMVVWIDPLTREYGLMPRAGYPGPDLRWCTYQLHPDIEFDLAVTSGNNSGMIEAAVFAPDSTLAIESLEGLSLIDRFEEQIWIEQTTNGWGYEILKDPYEIPRVSSLR